MIIVFALLIIAASISLTSSVSAADGAVFRGAASVLDGHRYKEVVHADFADEVYPSKAMDMLRLMSNVQTIVVGGPRYTDWHFGKLAELKSLRTLILDSTDVTDAAIERARRARPELEIYRSQRWAIKQIAALAREIVVGTEKIENWDSPEVARLRRLFADKHFVKATRVNFRPLLRDDNAPGDQFQNEDLQPLKYLDTVTELDLSYTRINDAGMHYLRPLVRVRALRLPLDEVTADGIAHLSVMNDLESFSGAIDDDMARVLGTRKKLKHLAVDPTGSVLSDRGLEHFKELSHLEMLRLARTKIRGDGLQHLAGLPKLRSLNLDECPLDDLSHIPLLPALRQLHLSKTNIEDEDLSRLADCKSLETLWMAETNVSDAGIVHLHALRSLNALNLIGTKVTDVSLQPLLELPNLRHLYIRGTKISTEGWQKLSEKAGLKLYD